MNSYRSANQQSQLDRAVVVATPSLTLAGNEPIAEEIIRDLLDQQWPQTTPRPHVLIPNDSPRSARAATRRTEADTISITNEGETEIYHGANRELVDCTTTVQLRIQVPLRNGRQRLHNLKAQVRSLLYRHAKVLSPYHILYYEGFTPTYTEVNIHAGDIVIKLEQQRIPLFGRVTRGQETPATSPELFPEGLRT